ncbi:MAG: SH3 beta-barrel fold-containing protein [Candidatus Anstonellales archaeon]
MHYKELVNKLNRETAIVIFFKRDGSIRTMLCTRNISTGMLSNGEIFHVKGNESKNNELNGNITVVDLEKNEFRAFNIYRVVYIEYLGLIDTQEKLERAKELCEHIRQRYNSSAEVRFNAL